MKALAIQPKQPKGSIVSPANREIVAYLEKHGPVKMTVLQDQFRDLALAHGKGVPKWLNDRLSNLRENGHLRRFSDEHGNVSWDVVRGSTLPELTEAPPEHVAQPRRVSMFGPVYMPPKVALRPGAMDYATVPSLHMGRRHQFRSGM